jgi:glycosyltransferase involved in cell wall biosynthesis
VSEQGKLKVLQLCSSIQTSGAERQVYDLSNNLRRRGYDIQAVTPSVGWLSTILQDAQIPVHTSPMRTSGWFRTIGYLIKRVKRENIDLIHAHLTRAAYIGYFTEKYTGVPIVTNVHVANNDVVYRKLARRNNRLVAVSNYVAGMLHGNGVPERYVDTVYNRTDFADIAPVGRPEDVKRDFGIEPDRRLIGLVGRICRDKGQVEMIHAMASVRSEHPNAHLMLVGKVDEPYRPEVQAAIESEGLAGHVTLTGLRHDVPRLLDALDLSAMPSYMETFGVAAIEAMARRKAVVATRVGALPEVVRDGQTGILVDLRSEQIAEAVSYLLANRPICEEMGATGRRIVEQKFTLDKMVGRFEQIYGGAVASRAARRR